MVSYLVLSLICIPLLWTVNFDELSSSFWLNIFFAALLDMAGTLFLVMSLSKTDLSIFGPLNAYKVVISMILAMMFLGEIPNSQGFLGIAVILVGSFFLFPRSAKCNGIRLLQLFTLKGVRYRFLSILLFSITKSTYLLQQHPGKRQVLSRRSNARFSTGPTVLVLLPTFNTLP